MALFQVEGSVSGNTRTWELSVPDEAWMRSQLIHALSLLAEPINWTVQGVGTEADIVDAAAFFQDMLDNFIETS